MRVVRVEKTGSRRDAQQGPCLAALASVTPVPGGFARTLGRRRGARARQAASRGDAAPSGRRSERERQAARRRARGLPPGSSGERAAGRGGPMNGHAVGLARSAERALRN